MSRILIGILASLLLCGACFAQVITLSEKTGETQRNSDIAGNLYNTEYVGSFSYSDPLVSVNYTTELGTLEGVISVDEGFLKPNFCYQLKLEGKPSFLYGDNGDDWSNEQLGLLGRWWMSIYDKRTGDYMGGSNSTDREYFMWKRKGFNNRTYYYVFTGYLVFDHVVTDGNGLTNVLQPFAVDSSFHVFWNTVLNTRDPGINDSSISYYQITPYSTAYEYPNDNTELVGIYGEWEPDRDLPGTLILPDGNYNIKFVMTEESFHLQGAWASILWADMVFSIGSIQPPPPPPQEDTGTISGTVVDGSTGNTVKKAVVSCYNSNNELVLTYITNPKGTYSFSELLYGNYTITVSATGYTPAQTELNLQSSKIILDFEL